MEKRGRSRASVPAWGSATVLVVVACCLFLGTTPAHAGIFEYNDALGFNSRILERVAMWSLDDTPAGSAQPEAKFDLTFTKHNRGGHIEALFFSIDELENVGFKGPAYGRYLCCAPNMHNPPHNPCPYGQVALNPSYYNYSSPTFHYERLDFLTSISAYAHDFPIEKTGLYYFILVNCQGSGVESVTVTGTTEWKNPYGYLNGDEFGFLPFYLIMALVYLVTTVAWAFLLYRFRSGLLLLQHCLTGIIAFGIVEQLLLWFDFYYYNSNGTISVPLTVIAVAATSLKQTLARLLLLAVCMGYGVVRKKMPWPVTLALVVYGVLFYLFSEVSESADALQDKTSLPINPAVTAFTLMPVFLLDAIYFVWVLMSLFRMTTLLRRAGQSAKLGLYTKLAVVLTGAFVLSLVVIVLEFVVLGFFADGLWKIWWVWDSYWTLMHFLILVAIAIIWRPNPNNGRYAYEELVSTEAGEDAAEAEAELEMEDMQAHRDTALGLENDAYMRQVSDEDPAGNDNKSKEEMAAP